MNNLIASNSIIEEDVTLGEGTNVWYFCHIRKGSKIGKNCNLGDYCYVDKGVIIGDDVKIGNKVSLYEGNIIKDRVFIGNNATFTNVRGVIPNRKGRIQHTIIEDDVYIGANATIVAGVIIGKCSYIAEGAIVFFNVPEGGFVAASHVAKSKNNIISNRYAKRITSQNY